MPDSSQITTIPSKPKKVPWWKKPWAWVLGGIAAVLLFLLVWYLKNQIATDQKQLAKLRTKAEIDRLRANNLEHKASLEENDVKATSMRIEVMRLKATAKRALEDIEKREKENTAQLKKLESISSWKELDAINESRK